MLIHLKSNLALVVAVAAPLPIPAGDCVRMYGWLRGRIYDIREHALCVDVQMVCVCMKLVYACIRCFARCVFVLSFCFYNRYFNGLRYVHTERPAKANHLKE